MNAKEASKHEERIALGGLIVSATLVILAALYLARLPIDSGLALIFADKRPALLQDAEWGDPTSAIAFERRFTPGVPEADLLTWLQSNDFEIDRSESTARRMIERVVCNELIEVDWVADPEADLVTASTTVREAGCL